MKKQLVAGALGVLLLFSTGTVQAGENREQTPFNKTELDKFLADYPGFTQWVGKQNNLSDPVRNPWVLSGMRFDKGFTALLKEKGWEPERFFYLLNHVNTGLSMVASEKSQADAQARMDREQKEHEARIAKDRQKMQQDMEAANQRMKEQLKAQQEQIRANPYIPPHEKQRILEQMNRGISTSKAAPPMDAQAAQAQWIASQEQSIRANPYMHPMQRQQALAQLQQTRLSMQQQVKNAPSQPQDPEAVRDEMRKMHKKWFENQKQVINNNPAVPAAQKKSLLEQLQNSEKAFTENLNAAPMAPTSLLPPAEKVLIESNQQKLNELFASKKSQ
ncbi:MAG: hypothetical protein HQL95_03155 [Magnetococcales bacterium]|nr:hypothetical protein [Magnetococcales bacterium]